MSDRSAFGLFHYVNVLLLCCILILSVISCSQDLEKSSAEILNRSLNGSPDSLDPHRFTSNQGADVLRDIGEGLLTYAPDGSVKLGVAKKWSVSSDGLVYRFELKPNARWSNGERVTALHFERAFQRLVDPHTGATSAQYLSPVSNAAKIISGEKDPSELGVKALSKRVLKIRLVAPTSHFPQLLTHPSTFPIYFKQGDKQDTLRTTDFDTSITNGAYVVEKNLINAYVSLAKNEFYWDSSNTKIRKVVYHIVELENELPRYLAGEIDITDNVSEGAFHKMMASRPSELKVSNMLGVYYYGFNLKRPPFKNNLALRAALSLAINRRALVDKVLDRGEKAAYSWVPPGTQNYSSPIMNFSEYSDDVRIKLARSMFEQAGYIDGRDLDLELRYNTSGGHKKIAVAIQSMWRDVLGIDAKLVNEEFRVFISNVRQMRETQAYRLSWTADYNDAFNFLSLFRSSSSSNLTGYSNKGFDELLSLAEREIDSEKRREYLEAAERLVLADHPGIPIYYYVSRHLVAPRVNGWTDNVLDIHRSQDLSLKSDERFN